MLTQIVIATDGSKQSIEACKSGISLASRIGCGVKVVFVVDSRKTEMPLMYSGSTFDLAFERIYIPPDPGLQKYYEKIREDLFSFGQNVLDTCKEIAEKESLDGEYLVREGLPSEKICEESHSGDILVIGQTGENSKFDRAIVGSTTEDVVRTSPRPVLVVSGEQIEYKTVLFAYDGSRSAENALRFYVNALNTVWERLVLLHIGEEGPVSRELDEECEFLEGHNINYSILTKEGKVVESICEASQEVDADVVLLGSHGQRKIRDYLLGSTTSHLVRKSKLPILIVY
ncbi:MAG: universal stress protein [Spirochaetia bacterium]